jgi:hypothetical protein
VDEDLVADGGPVDVTLGPGRGSGDRLVDLVVVVMVIIRIRLRFVFTSVLMQCV